VLTDHRRGARLWAYRSDHKELDDFDAFWQATLAENADFPLDVHSTPVEANLRTVEVFDLTFAGFGGHPVRAPGCGCPRHRTGPLPGVVQFHGYASGRGARPSTTCLWGERRLCTPIDGCAGVRGGDYAGGRQTGDPVGSGPSYPGFSDQGDREP